MLVVEVRQSLVKSCLRLLYVLCGTVARLCAVVL